MIHTLREAATGLLLILAVVRLAKMRTEGQFKDGGLLYAKSVI